MSSSIHSELHSEKQVTTAQRHSRALDSSSPEPSGADGLMSERATNALRITFQHRVIQAWQPDRPYLQQIA